MRKVLKIDAKGFYIEDVILKDEITPNDCIEIECLGSFYKPRWNGIEWFEGATEEEINSIKNQPTPKTREQLLEEELNRVKAMQAQQNEDFNSFMEFYFAN